MPQKLFSSPHPKRGNARPGNRNSFETELKDELKLIAQLTPERIKVKNMTLSFALDSKSTMLKSCQLVRANPFKRELCVFESDQFLKVFNVRTGEMGFTFKLSIAQVIDCRFVSEDLLALGSADKKLSLFNIAQGLMVQ